MEGLTMVISSCDVRAIFRLRYLAKLICVAVLALLGRLPETNAQESIPSDVIQGKVSSAQGPEAGVWVIAETTDLPTRFVKIVVTDDAGRYVLPDLPKANYDIWVRGYGLVDSTKIKGAPGNGHDLNAVVA